MSDNFNPKDLEVIGDELSFSEPGTLNSNNSEDTLSFTLPTLEDIASGRELDKVELRYNFDVEFFTLDEPVKLSVGIDSNSDGKFDQANEILGSQIIVKPDASSNVLISSTDIVTNPSIPEDLLKPNQTLFLDLESTDPNTSNDYDLDFNLTPVFAGELTTSDDLYCCDGSHNDKYYYDRLDELSVRAGDEYTTEVGYEFDLSLTSDSFAPVLFLLNQDTGAVIDVASVTTSQTIGGVDFQTVDLSFTVEDNINYVVSAESALPNQTGDYFLSVL